MYPPLFTPEEAYRLNTLIGQALSEPELCQRLLAHDTRLIIEFSLPQSVWWIVSTIQAKSLDDFCKQLVDLELQP